MSVAASHLVKDYGAHRVVDGVSFEAAPGELLTLLGPSGCGKTTTLRMIAGFEEPTSGTIAIAGRDVTRLPAHQRDTPLVFQSYALFPHLSVRENIAFGLGLRRVSKEEAKRRIEALAEPAGLLPLLDRAPNQLSGGQQQRVALLRALVLDPRVLLFDEPLSNLDANLRASMRAEIRRAQKRAGFTALYVTHDQAEAMSISDRVAVMNRGKVVQLAPPSEIYNHPADRFVASFLGEASFVAANVVERAASGLTVQSALGPMTVRNPGIGSDKVTLVIRPERVRLGPLNGALRGRIRSAMYLGSESAYQVAVNGLALGARVPNPSAAPPIAEDSEVGVSIDAESLHVLEGDG